VLGVRPAREIVPEPACERVPVIAPGLEVAVYEVIVAPPLLAGAVNATVAVVLPVAVAEPIVGACGTVAAVIELEDDDAGLTPAELVAVTVNAYAVADASPVTVRGLDPPDAVKLSGDEVTV
jgi:hypothetical protein